MSSLISGFIYLWMDHGLKPVGVIMEDLCQRDQLVKKMKE